MSINIICKESRSIAFNKSEINNFSNSELLKDMISSANDEEINVNNISYDQLVIYKEFSEASDYSDFYIKDNILLSKDDKLSLIKEEFPKLEEFINKINSVKRINEYYAVSDFLGVKLLDQILILICLKLINNSDTALSIEEKKRLKEKYLPHCEEKLHSLDENQLDDLIKS